ncbi:MAG: glycosyltransferase family 39 protein [Planctomycetota bacterium]|nr:glycosyltransferase family 39 protein [Planctomycetota bacterium]
MEPLIRSAAWAILTPALIVLLARVILQGLLLPTELSGDEAQYWDWSRQLQLSYYTKGPGVALIIALFTGIFGDNELGVRFGSYIAHALVAIFVGILGFQLSGGSKRVVWLTSIGYQCTLGYQIGGSLMTVDMPMMVGWSLATVAAVAAVQRAREGRPVGLPLIIAGAALGFSFLAKYTALLGGLGILIGIWPWRKQLWSCPGARSGVLAGSLLLSAGLAPVVIWNAERGWPTVQHLLGHISVPGGDSGVVAWSDFEFSWPLTYLLQVVALPGPLLAVAMGLGILAWKKGRLVNPPPELRIALWSAVPLLIFYLIVSLKGPTEGNWTAGAAAGLLPFAALWFESQQRGRLALWLGRGVLLRSTLSLLLILTLPWSGPTVSGWLSRSSDSIRIPLHRVTGHESFAKGVRQLATEALGAAGNSAPIVCDYYDRTALLAFYLPEQPVVHCASRHLGARRSAYDDLIRTRFIVEDFAGTDLILVGASEERWRLAFEFTHLKNLGTLLQRDRQRSVFHARVRSVKEGA